MRKPNLTLWNVPLDCVPAIMETVKRECCCAIHLNEMDKTDALLYCLKGMQEDYDRELTEYERLTEPEEEGDVDE